MNSALFKEHLKNWGVSIVLLPVILYFLFNYGEYTLLDNADLVIHEAGHIFFGFFGRFIIFAGGTLMQIIIPSIIAWYFLAIYYRTGLQFSLLWLGHNFINISVYAADASSRRLPLITGDKGTHDWWNMLRMLGLLEYDYVFGYFFLALAIITFIILLLIPLKMTG